MNTELQKTNTQLAIPTDLSFRAMEMGMGMGDFSGFSPEDKLKYLAATCQSMGLNPLTLPIRIIKMDGRDVMYATAECAAQLRNIHNVSLQIIDRQASNGCYIVTVKATLPNGRSDESTGAVSLVYPDKISEWSGGQRLFKTHPKAGQPLTGIDYANAIKKAETQAKRRAAMSICGMGMLEESEIESGSQLFSGSPTVISETPSAGDRAKTLTAEIVGEDPAERSSILESVKFALISLAPGETVTDKKRKADLLQEVFGVRSWAVVEKKTIDELNRGLGMLQSKLIQPVEEKQTSPEVVQENPPEDFAKPEPVVAVPILSSETLTKLEEALGLDAPDALKIMRTAAIPGGPWLKDGQGFDQLTEARAKKVITQLPAFMLALNNWRAKK